MDKSEAYGGCKLRTRYDLLLANGHITYEDLGQALDKARGDQKDLDQVLVEDFGVSREAIGESFAHFYDAEFVPYDPEAKLPGHLLRSTEVEPEFLKKYSWTPYRQNGSTVEVLVDNPFDLGKVDEIRFVLGVKKIRPKVAIRSDIEAFIDNFFERLDQEREDEEPSSEGGLEDRMQGGQGDDDSELDDIEDADTEDDNEVVKIVNALLQEAYKKGASDVHIEPSVPRKQCIVRMRVDGSCFVSQKLRLNLAKPIISRIKIMAKLDIAEKRLPQDGKIKVRLPQEDEVVEFRVATMPTMDGQEDAVMRLLASGEPLPLDKLGLAGETLPKFRQMVSKPYGMILVVGPTGSGKTTTLHSALHCVNTSDKKIWTAEDPVEITQYGLRQVQVNHRIGFGFAEALRSFLRADPDIIMIGEMRDKETAHIGVEASLTGHLVFSTLHTNSAAETVTRLLDMDLDPFNFADSLLCVLAQRLAKTLCPYCRITYKPESREVEELKEEFGEGWENHFPQWFLEDPVLYQPRGCRWCMEGYKGRIGVHELLLNNDSIKTQIKRQETTENMKAASMKEGMLTLKQDAILKVINGSIDLHQARMVSG